MDKNTKRRISYHNNRLMGSGYKVRATLTRTLVTNEEGQILHRCLTMKNALNHIRGEQIENTSKNILKGRYKLIWVRV